MDEHAMSRAGRRRASPTMPSSRSVQGSQGGGGGGGKKPRAGYRAGRALEVGAARSTASVSRGRVMLALSRDEKSPKPCETPAACVMVPSGTRPADIVYRLLRRHRQGETDDQERTHTPADVGECLSFPRPQASLGLALGLALGVVVACLFFGVSAPPSTASRAGGSLASSGRYRTRGFRSPWSIRDDQTRHACVCAPRILVTTLGTTPAVR